MMPPSSDSLDSEGAGGTPWPDVWASCLITTSLYGLTKTQFHEERSFESDSMLKEVLKPAAPHCDYLVAPSLSQSKTELPANERHAAQLFHSQHAKLHELLHWLRSRRPDFSLDGYIQGVVNSSQRMMLDPREQRFLQWALSELARKIGAERIFEHLSWMTEEQREHVLDVLIGYIALLRDVYPLLLKWGRAVEIVLLINTPDLNWGQTFELKKPSPFTYNGFDCELYEMLEKRWEFCHQVTPSYKPLISGEVSHKPLQIPLRLADTKRQSSVWLIDQSWHSLTWREEDQLENDLKHFILYDEETCKTLFTSSRTRWGLLSASTPQEAWARMQGDPDIHHGPETMRLYFDAYTCLIYETYLWTSEVVPQLTQAKNDEELCFQWRQLLLKKRHLEYTPETENLWERITKVALTQLGYEQLLLGGGQVFKTRVPHRQPEVTLHFQDLAEQDKDTVYKMVYNLSRVTEMALLLYQPHTDWKLEFSQAQPKSLTLDEYTQLAQVHLHSCGQVTTFNIGHQKFTEWNFHGGRCQVLSSDQEAILKGAVKTSILIGPLEPYREFAWQVLLHWKSYFNSSANDQVKWDFLELLGNGTRVAEEYLFKVWRDFQAKVQESHYNLDHRDLQGS